MTVPENTGGDPKKSQPKPFVTPLKREPVSLFGKPVPASVVVPEKLKDTLPAARPAQPPEAPVATTPSVEPTKPSPIVPIPSPVVKAPAPPRPPKADPIRKMPTLNRRAEFLDDEVEAELAAALGEGGEDSFYAADSASTAQRAGGGQKKIGKVLSIHGDDVFVDIGGRTQGVIPFETFAEEPKVGDEVEVFVKGFDSANGIMLLALPGASETHVDWSSVARGMIVEARVTGTNKGGLSVEVNGIRGFLPISQLELFRVDDTALYVNQRLRCLVTEVEPTEKNLVLSRRALLEQERAQAKEKLWTELAEGQKRSAIVGNIKDFGAFVDLGGCDALLPAGEIAWQKVDDVSKFLTPGQRIEVKVIRLDRERQKVTVSLRECMSSPWDEVGDKYPVGTVTPGKVTRTTEYGAFIELEPGVEGLLHISEVASKRIYRVTDVVKEGQNVEVKVIKYDADTKRLSLSLKAIQKEKEEAAQTAAEEAQVKQDAEQPAEPVKPIVRRTDLKGGLSR